KQWGTFFGQEFLNFPALFGHQYTHVWTDLRDIRDPYMKQRGIDYFENSRRAVYAQRAYAVANPRRCRDYGETIWGITASDGPADVEIEDATGRHRFRSSMARGVDPAGRHDDCTLRRPPASPPCPLRRSSSSRARSQWPPASARTTTPST